MLLFVVAFVVQLWTILPIHYSYCKTRQLDGKCNKTKQLLIFNLLKVIEENVKHSLDFSNIFGIYWTILKIHYTHCKMRQSDGRTNATKHLLIFSLLKVVEKVKRRDLDSPHLFCHLLDYLSNSLHTV